MNKLNIIKGCGVLCLCGAAATTDGAERPNILYIMADDHTSQAIGAYATLLKGYFETPNIDRIGREGVVMDNCFVPNSISAPSRASILTGQYSHHNGVPTLLDALPAGSDNFAKHLQGAGYATAMIGKWHLATEPEGFDYYSVLPGQGDYTNPSFMQSGCTEFKPKYKVTYTGHSTDIIADQSIEWMKSQAKGDNPFMLMCHFKAPHTPFTAAPRHAELYEDVVFPEPENLYDTYEGRSTLAKVNSKIENNRVIDRSLPREERRKLSYQNFIRKYLRCIAAVDENVGRLLDYLEKSGEIDNTIIIYTADQGFFVGEHGLVDKRLMYDECIKMPLLIRYPKSIKQGQRLDNMVMNIDFAPTLLDYAGVETPKGMDGWSFRAILEGREAAKPRDFVYYHYSQQVMGYNIPAHFGIRTERYKLLYFYGHKNLPEFEPVWELYDREKDPAEMVNLIDDSRYADVVEALKRQLFAHQDKIGDPIKLGR